MLEPVDAGGSGSMPHYSRSARRRHQRRRSKDDRMNIQGSFRFQQSGYTVHWDKPRTNGSGSSAREKDNGTSDEARAKRHGKQQSQETPRPIHGWDDPDWSILDDRRGDLPEFPVDALST